MTLKEKEERIASLEEKLNKIKDDPELSHHLEIDSIQKTIDAYKEETYTHLTPYDHVLLARKKERPHIKDYINALFDTFYEMHGDRYFGDDQAIVGGIASFHHLPVTVIGHQKGRSLDENMKCKFGMGSPEGFRKGIRLMKQAEKFCRPIITFIDTPGAYPGIEAEENNVGEAIGQSLMYMSHVSVPVITIVTGEGGSGGALALSIGDHFAMLENAVYSVLSPEGFSSILWKDIEGKRIEEACDVMKLTAQNLHDFGIVDEIIPEALGGVNQDPHYTYRKIRDMLEVQLDKLVRLSSKDLVNRRYKKYRKIGDVHG